jgi:outer membrane protein assembly factor BamB
MRSLARKRTHRVAFTATVAGAAVLASTVLASTVLAGTSAPAAVASFPASSWPTYDQNVARTGIAPVAAPPGNLSIAWRSVLDGAVYGQPLLVASVVVVATENDTIYALQSATGRVAWRAHVGTPVPRRSLPCGNIDPLGITGTPVYDQATGLIYAVAETTGFRHTLFGVSVANGAVKVRRYIPTPDGQEKYDQQRAALTIAGGRVYVAFGGLFGDCGPYRGSVVGVALSGSGSLVSYVVPTSREAGIWATGGPVQGPDGTLYVTTGNGAATGGRYDFSDSLTHLSPGLKRIGYFAPATWASDNANDFDLSSSPPALAASNSIFVMGKRGVGYLVRRGALGNVGGDLAHASICRAYGTAAVNGGTVYEPCTDRGLAAIAVNASTKSIRVLWSGPSAAHGSPAIGGGAIWVPDSQDGILFAVSPADGHVLHQVKLNATLPRFSSVSLAGTHAYVATLTGVVAVAGA